MCTVRTMGASADVTQRTCRMVCKRPEPPRQLLRLLLRSIVDSAGIRAWFLFRLTIFFRRGTWRGTAVCCHGGGRLLPRWQPLTTTLAILLMQLPRLCCARGIGVPARL